MYWKEKLKKSPKMEVAGGGGGGKERKEKKLLVSRVQQLNNRSFRKYENRE